MAGALLLGLILVIAYPVYSPGRRAATPRPAVAGPVAGPAGIDLSSMTPREAADRLFNRVMTAVAADDSTEASTFLPMAIAAFELAEPLDTDGKFHVVLLRLTGQFNAEALEGAEEILSEQPNPPPRVGHGRGRVIGPRRQRQCSPVLPALVGCV